MRYRSSNQLLRLLTRHHSFWQKDRVRYVHTAGLDDSCEYQSIGQMTYARKAPEEDIDEDSVFHLRLTTDDSSTTHLSGEIRQARAEDANSHEMRMGRSEGDWLSAVNRVWDGVGEGSFVGVGWLGGYAAPPWDHSGSFLD